MVHVRFWDVAVLVIRCCGIYFPDVAVRNFSMLQHIIFDVTTQFGELQYLYPYVTLHSSHIFLRGCTLKCFVLL